MIDNLQIYILFLIDKKTGANKQFYLPFRNIYNGTPDEDSEDDVSEALDGLTNLGYLESRDRSYRLTQSGLIFIEAYIISKDMIEEIGDELSQEIKEELEEKMKTSVGYQWLVIVIAFLAILTVVLLK